MNNFVLRITEEHLKRAIKARKARKIRNKNIDSEIPDGYTKVCLLAQAAKDILPELKWTSYSGVFGKGFSYVPVSEDQRDKLRNLVRTFDSSREKINGVRVEDYSKVRSMLPFEIEMECITSSTRD